LRLTLVGRAKKYHRTVQKYVCTVQYLDGLRQCPNGVEVQKTAYFHKYLPLFPSSLMITELLLGDLFHSLLG
jgi:hypothetical protein